jgi:hypothetical protein
MQHVDLSAAEFEHPFNRMDAFDELCDRRDEDMSSRMASVVDYAQADENDARLSNTHSPNLPRAGGGKLA